MSSDRAARWVKLGITCAVAFLGVIAASNASGFKSITFATLVQATVALLTTLQAGVSQSPAGPVETLNVNPKTDPVITQEAPKP